MLSELFVTLRTKTIFTQEWLTKLGYFLNFIGHPFTHSKNMPNFYWHPEIIDELSRYTFMPKDIRGAYKISQQITHARLVKLGSV